MRFADLLVERAKGVPAQKPFLLRSGLKALSWGELLGRVGRVSALLRRKGLGPGDRIALCTRRDEEFVVLLLAALGQGIVFVGLDPDAGPQRLQAIARQARPALIAMDAGLVPKFDQTTGTPFMPIHDGGWPDDAPLPGWLGNLVSSDPGYPGLAARLDPLPPAPAPPDAPAYIVYTSGTTAAPKGVVITHGNLLSHLSTLARVFGYTKASRILNPLNLVHADGCIEGPLIAFFVAGSVSRVGGYDIPRLAELLQSIRRDKITNLVTVPAAVNLMLRLGKNHRDAFAAPEFRFAISFAAPLEPLAWEAFERTFGAPLCNVYGLTETVSGGLFAGPDPGSRKIGTVGRPEDCHVRIVDQAGDDTPDGSAGELLLRGSNVMSGYFDRPDMTAAAIRRGWLHTGDIARRDEDGCYVILGRLKNIIVSGGFNIHPQEVTEALQTHPGIRQACVFGEPDPLRGERVVACVVADPVSPPSDWELTAHCRARLEHFKIPARLVFLEDLPRGPSGKVKLDELRHLASART